MSSAASKMANGLRPRAREALRGPRTSLGRHLLATARGGFNQFDETPGVAAEILVFTRLASGGECLLVPTEAVVKGTGNASDTEHPTFTPCSPVADETPYMTVFASREAQQIGVTMTTTVLGVKIEAAKQRISAAERELASELQKLTVAAGGETTFVAKLLERAFGKLRDAQRHLADLNHVLHTGDVALRKQRA